MKLGHRVCAFSCYRAHAKAGETVLIHGASGGVRRHWIAVHVLLCNSFIGRNYNVLIFGSFDLWYSFARWALLLVSLHVHLG